MKILRFFFLLLCACPLVCTSVCAQKSDAKADSIIRRMLALRPDYGRLLQNYQAEVYLKGYTKILTHNKLYSYAPSLLYLDRRGKNPLIECLLDVHYRSPNIFTSKIKAIRGGQMANDDVNNRNLPFLNVNIYNPSVFDNQILIPDEKQLFDYYDFKYIEGIAANRY